MRKLFTVLLLICSVRGAFAQAKWAEDVAPILYNRCASCHHSGGLAPFPLITYNEAVAYAASIAHDVSNRIMPPWPPDPHYARLAHERLLSNSEISTLLSWVNGNTPQGNVSAAPTPPMYNSNSQIGTADLTVTIPTYTSTATSTDMYRCFVMPTNVAANKFITTMEVIPGNGAIVHHVLVYYDTSSVAYQLDAADPGPGYTNFGGSGSSTARLIGAWVPGSMPMYYPSGFGMQLPANAHIILQIHYPQGSNGQADSTKVNFKLSTATLRPLFMDAVLSHGTNMTNGPLIIPANTTKTFYERYVVPVDVSVLNVAPHMHLIGRSMKVYAIKTGNDTLGLIDIPEWDFHWQGSYDFRKMLHFPVGTVLEAEAFYDNTTANPENPSNPPQLVYAGEGTTDEMMLSFFTYTAYFPGDENIVIDNSPLVDLTAATNPIPTIDADFTLYPVPAIDQIQLHFNKALTVNELPVQVYTMQGQLLYQWPVSLQQSDMIINVKGLSAGTYLLKAGQQCKVFSKQ